MAFSFQQMFNFFSGFAWVQVAYVKSVLAANGDRKEHRIFIVKRDTFLEVY